MLSKLLFKHGITAVTQTGQLYTWGLGTQGQTGANNTTDRLSPVLLTGSSWTSISTGRSHSVAIRQDGTLWAWGVNNFGQLGDGTLAHRSSPVQISGTWSYVETKDTSTYGVKSDGSLWSWGYNNVGQLGHNTSLYAPNGNADLVVGPYSWTNISLGYQRAIAIRSDGTLWGWGGSTSFEASGTSGTAVTKSSPVQIGSASNWTNVSSGINNSIVINSLGEMYGWAGSAALTTRVLGYTNPVRSWTQVTGNEGTSTYFAIKDDGTLWGWGLQIGGQFGNNTGNTSIVEPTKLIDYSWTSVSAGGTHVVALKSDGTLWGWGGGGIGELGQKNIISKSSPVQISTDNNWVKVNAAVSTTVALKSDGTLWGWGNNTHGQIGATSDPISYSQIASIYQGTAKAAIRTDGTLWVWGPSSTFNYTNIPFQIQPGYSWTKVSTGYYISNAIVNFAAIRSDGTLWTWGSGSVGQLGNNTNGISSSPVQVGSDATWTDISTHGGVVLALKSDSTLWGWGNNLYGQLGDGTKVFRSSPVQLWSGTGSSWITISASADVAHAIRSDGTLWNAGINTAGALGTSQASTTYRSSPVQVGSLSWKNIKANGDSTLTYVYAIRSDDTLWAWGYNSQGQLGDSTIANKSSPVQIAGSWSQVGTQGAIKTDGTLWVWGLNTNSALGDGTNANRSSPVQIGVGSSWTQLSYQFAIKDDAILYNWGYDGVTGTKTTPSANVMLGDTIHRSSPVQISSKSWSDFSLGNGFTLAKATDGTLWSWGLNSEGTLGNGLIIHRSSPVQISTSSWSVISAGYSNASAIKSDGTLWVWGSGVLGAMGQNDVISRSSPVQVGSDTIWTKVQSAGQSVYGIKSNGSMWAWGGNGSNTFTLGQGTAAHRSSPVQIGVGTSWTSLSSSIAFDRGEAAIANDNRLYVWGPSAGTTSQQNMIQYGVQALSVPSLVGNIPGDGTGNMEPSSNAIIKLNDYSWTNVSVGRSHNLAIRSDGTLWAWGYNTYGQLGYTEQPKSWTMVDTKCATTLAIRSDGKLFGWGNNSTGQLGQNDNVHRSSPVQIGTDSWVNITHGTENNIPSSFMASYGIKYDGSLWSWGANNYGQLGNNSTASNLSPILIGNGSSWTKIAAGIGHALAIRQDGTLWAWGLNANGQLGDSTIANRSSPVQVGVGFSWASVSASNSWTAAIRSDGTLWTWGWGLNGQLGTGVNLHRSSPVQVSGGGSWLQISTTEDYAAAIKTDNTLYTWGNNNQGQLGVASATVSSRSSPAQVGSSLWSIVSVASANGAGKFGTGITIDGKLFTWGSIPITGLVSGLPGQVGSSSWASVSAGHTQIMAISSDGTLWGWGLNAHGQIGDYTVASKTTLVGINGLAGTTFNRSGPTQIDSGTWTKVSAGWDNSAAIKSDGSLWTWGRNEQGQLGRSLTLTTNVLSPVQVGTSSWGMVSTGAANIYGIDINARLFAWGNNTWGQLGTNNTATVGARSSPVQVGTSSWAQVAANVTHVTALTVDGTLWGWGTNSAGGVGDNTIINRSSPVQIGTNYISLVSALGTGGDGNGFSTNNGALDTNYKLYLWGNNSTTQLLTRINGSSTVNRSAPTQIGSVDILISPIQIGTSSWLSVSSGLSHALAVTTDGKLFNWGLNTNGQLGDTTVVAKSSPIQVKSGTSFAQISAGFNHSMATDSSDNLWAWGNNSTGQLGDITLIHRSSPVQVGTAVSKISGGNQHSLYINSTGTLYGAGQGYAVNPAFYSWTQMSMCTNPSYAAIREDGTLWTWGEANSFGSLGHNTVVTASSPVQVAGGGSWSQVSVTLSNTAAIKTDGTLWTWGADDYGQLGNNPFLPYSWTQINTNSSAKYAIRSDGTLWFWGSAGTQLTGFGITTGARSSPVQLGTDSWLTLGTGGRQTQFAIKANGTLWGWGQNTNGMLGDGTAIHRSSPVQIGIGFSWTAVVNGQTATAAIRSDGLMFSWGGNSNGELGSNVASTVFRSSPVQIGTGFSWIMLAGSGNETRLAIRQDGTLWGWGQGSGGIIGDIAATNRSSPVQVGVGFSWTTVCTQGSTTHAIRQDGTLWGWGANATYNLIGDNTTIGKSSPVQVGVGFSWTTIRTSEANRHAIRSDGTLWGWGANAGALLIGGVGDNTIIHRSSPVQLGTDSWLTLGTGEGGGRNAIRQDGTLWAWGPNTNGENGDNTIIARSSPVQVGLPGYKGTARSSPAQISAGGSWTQVAADLYGTTVAIKADGTLWGWGGGNIGGGIGDGTTISRSSPVQIGASSWTSIVARGPGFYGIQVDGTLWGWGLSSFAPIGDGVMINRSSPVQIGIGNSFTSISTSSGNTFAIASNGALWAWGSQKNGAMGNGVNNTSYLSSPVQVFSGKSFISVGAFSSDGVYACLGIDNNNLLWGWGALDRKAFANSSVNALSPIQLGTKTWSQVIPPQGRNFLYSTGALIGTNGKIYILGSTVNPGDGLYYAQTYQKSYPAVIGYINNSRSSFTQVGSLSWNAISANDHNTFAIASDNTLYSWGRNDFGEGGNLQAGGNFALGYSESSVVLTSTDKVSGGDYHGLVIKK